MNPNLARPTTIKVLGTKLPLSICWRHEQPVLYYGRCPVCEALAKGKAA